MQDFLHEIYFLPDHPELEKIKAVLQEYRKVFHFFIYDMEDLEYKIVPDSSTLRKTLYHHSLVHRLFRVIPVFWKQSQEDLHTFEASMFLMSASQDNIENPVLKNKKI